MSKLLPGSRNFTLEKNKNKSSSSFMAPLPLNGTAIEKKRKFAASHIIANALQWYSKISQGGIKFPNVQKQTR